MKTTHAVKNQERLPRKEILRLLELPPDAPETYAPLARSNALSKELVGGHAAIHGQLGLDREPCPCNYIFCSFSQTNRVFQEETRL